MQHNFKIKKIKITELKWMNTNRYITELQNKQVMINQKVKQNIIESWLNEM